MGKSPLELAIQKLGSNINNQQKTNLDTCTIKETAHAPKSTPDKKNDPNNSQEAATNLVSAKSVLGTSIPKTPISDTTTTIMTSKAVVATVTDTNTTKSPSTDATTVQKEAHINDKETHISNQTQIKLPGQV